MSISENGWQTLESDSRNLYTWHIRTKAGFVDLRLRNGSVGLVLAYAFMLFSDLIETTVGKVRDDWGWASRPIRGQTTLLSNHYSGTAWDANAMRHPLGRVGTLLKAAAWRTLLRVRLGGLLRWGGDYHNRKDEMHTEIAPGVTMEQCEALADKILKRKRGIQLIKDNPTQLRVIQS